MEDLVRRLEEARLALADALERDHGARAESGARAYDAVDEVVSALLLGHEGVLGRAVLDDLRSGSRTLEALRVVAQTWWTWRSAAPNVAMPEDHLRELVAAAGAWIAAFDGTPAEVLLACHELRLASDRESRRRTGAFYTPSAVAESLVDEALRTVTRTPGKPPRFFDPACGTGVFLVAAFRRLADAQIDQPMEGSFARRLALAAATIHGVDCDARAVDLARRAILLSVVDDPRVHEELALALAFPASATIGRAVAGIVHGDSLLVGASEQAASRVPWTGAPPVNWAKTFAQAIAAGGFDVVVGNPPFASYAGREGQTIASDLREHFEKHHGAFRWPSLHGWFLSTAARFWGRDTLALVLPEQVCHLAGYADLRSFVAERFELRRAQRLADDTFGDAVAPSASVVFKRRTSVAPPVDDPWLAPERPRAIDRLVERGSSLRGWFLDCGIRTTNRTTQVRRIGEGESGAEWVSVLEGKDIGLWRTGVPRVEVRVGEGVHVSPRSRYDRVSYVLRQTAAYPICARKVGADYFRNSLLGVAVPEDPPCDVRYVVAFLNSRLARYLYVVLVQEASQRVFPQVKLAALARLPVRIPEGPTERALHDRIVMLAERRLASPIAPDVAARIEMEIDTAIEELHEVDDVLRDAMVTRLASVPRAP